MSGTRQPPALKHGLTSLTARAEWSGDMITLADAILGDAPREPQVVEAARAEAEAILYLRRVRQCRLQALEEATLRRAAPTERERALAVELSGALKTASLPECLTLRETVRAEHDENWRVGLEVVATFILSHVIGNCTTALRRINDYERRAQSRWTKTRRCFDYERIDAERRARRQM